MHPDEAVDLALQDLRALTHPGYTASGTRRASWLRAAWRRYMDGWTWYAASELALPEPGAGAPARRVSVPAPARTRVLRCAHPRFELLFGRAAAGVR
ncbi:MAG: hypothetical protein JO306_09780 [Gemmatimonadetes bacterium]|nr:hypothetical protein [Gemmatimonadota bacterium]